MGLKRYFILVFAIFIAANVSAQSRMTRAEYIEKYKQNVEAKKAAAEQVSAEQDEEASKNDNSESQASTQVADTSDNNSGNTTDS